MADKFSTSYVKTLDSFNIIIKLLLVIFLDFIVYGIYRICKGKILIGIIWIITIGFLGIGWIIDIVSIILYKKVKLLA